MGRLHPWDRIDLADDEEWLLQEGKEPTAVLRCKHCKKNPDLEADRVQCPLCRRRTPPMPGAHIEQIVEKWNELNAVNER